MRGGLPGTDRDREPHQPAVAVQADLTGVLRCKESTARTSLAAGNRRQYTRRLLGILTDNGNHVAADTIHVPAHSLTHLLLRGLDDGQIGFAEATLAKWLAPETLTFAIHANTLKDSPTGRYRHR